MIDRQLKIAGRIERQYVGGALYDFLGYLTSQENALTDGPQTNASVALNVLFAWMEQRHPELAREMQTEEMDVLRWNKKI